MIPRAHRKVREAMSALCFVKKRLQVGRALKTVDFAGAYSGGGNRFSSGDLSARLPPTT